MEGDFTRYRGAGRNYSGVLMQQGRVQLDADWNEQGVIQTESLRAALRDIIGPHGGPKEGLGFEITAAGDDLTAGAGIYYVDGIRCHAVETQKLSMANHEPGTYLAFLEVWERHVNAIEAEGIREVALLGPDTATRSEVLWRVRLMGPTDPKLTSKTDVNAFVESKLRAPLASRLGLAARAHTAQAVVDPCMLSPTAQYRGPENQLYRVEIHAGPTITLSPPAKALFTFKWSRENGSVVFPILPETMPKEPGVAGDNIARVTVQVTHLGRDARFGLVVGDIVEFVDDQLTRGQRDSDVLVEGKGDHGVHGVLGRVMAVDPDTFNVTVDVFSGDLVRIATGALNPYLRRWDQRDVVGGRGLVDGAVPVYEDDLKKWIALEDGVEVRFANPAQNSSGTVRARDFWVIPARVATGNVIWPKAAVGDDPPALPPMGVSRHYAPLAIVKYDGTSVTNVVKTRRQFEEIAKPE